MADWLFTINFNDGEPVVDITDYVKLETLRSTKQLYNDLKPSVNSCSFDLVVNNQDSRDILGKLLRAENNKTDYIIVIKDHNGDDYFNGFIRKNFEIRSTILIDGVKIECIDPGYLLKKKIDSNISWTNYKVWDSSNESASIVHQLFALANINGLTIDDVDDTAASQIDKTIDFFIVDRSDDKTYWDVLENLLYEFHYVFYFDNHGHLCSYDWNVDSVAGAGLFESYTDATDPGNMLGEIRIKKTQEKYKAAKVSWWAHEVLTDQVLSDDSAGVDLQPLCYYPGNTTDDPIDEDTGESTTKITYTVQNREIIAATAAHMDTDMASGITQTICTFVNHYKHGTFAVYNPDNLLPFHITKFNVVGDTVVVKGDKTIEISKFNSGDEEIYSFESQYIIAHADGVGLADALMRYYLYSDFQYTITSSSDYDLYEIGDIVRIIDRVSKVGTDIEPDRWVYGVVAETKDSWYYRDGEWINKRIHTLVGVSEFAATYRESSLTVEKKVVGLDTTAYATYANIQAGYTAGGGTTTPTVPTVYAYPVATKATKIEWDRQYNLTNLSHYLLQVSEDNTNWYSLSNDGSEITEGTPDGSTRVEIETYIHSNIPNAGTVDNPTGRLLYYRVKRVCIDTTESAYSSPVGSTTTATIGPGDIAVNAVFSNSVSTGFLNALIAQINEYLQVSPSGYMGSTTTEIEGAQRARLDKNELTIEYYTGGAWTTVCKLGGDENGGFFPYAQLKGIAKPGAAQELGDIGVGDLIPPFSYLYDLEGDTKDQYNADNWVVTNELFTPVKFGDGIVSDAGVDMSMIDSTARGFTFSTGAGISAYLDNTSFNATPEEILKLENNDGSFVPYSTSWSYKSTGVSTTGYDTSKDFATMVDATHSVSIYRYYGGGSTYYVMGICSKEGVLQTQVMATSTSNQVFTISNVVRLSDTSFVFAYTELSNGGLTYTIKKIEGTLSGDTISFGSPTTVYTATSASTGLTIYSKIDRVSDTTYLICYNNILGEVYAVVNGGSAVKIDDGLNNNYIMGVVVFGSTSAMCLHTKGSGTVYGVGITLSGTTVSSSGSATSSAMSNIVSVDKSSTTVAILSNQNTGTSKITAAAVSISGNTLTFGSAVEIYSYGAEDIEYNGHAYITTIAPYSHFVCIWWDDDDNALYSKSFKVNGTTITAGVKTTVFTPTSYNTCIIPKSSGTTTHSARCLSVWGSGQIYSFYAYFSYMKFSVYAGQYSGDNKLQFRLYNAGLSISDDSVYSAVLSTGLIHLGIGYDTAKFEFSIDDDTTISDITVASRNSSPVSMTIFSRAQRQWWDDILFNPGTYISETTFIEHYNSDNPWSVSIDEDLDLLIIPKSGGSIICTGKVRGLNSDWTAPASFTNSWVDYGSSYDTAAYRINPDGDIELKGVIKDGTAGQSAFTLPVGYRPAAHLVFATDNNGGYASVIIEDDGSVKPSSNTRLSLAGIKFSPA